MACCRGRNGRRCWRWSADETRPVGARDPGCVSDHRTPCGDHCGLPSDPRQLPRGRTAARGDDVGGGRRAADRGKQRGDRRVDRHDRRCRWEWSPFEEQHGFSIDGVDLDTAVLPVGWQDRLAQVDARHQQAAGVALRWPAALSAPSADVSGGTFAVNSSTADVGPPWETVTGRVDGAAHERRTSPRTQRLPGHCLGR